MALAWQEWLALGRDDPWLRRRLGLNPRGVLLARLALPTLLSAMWTTAALVLLVRVEALPGGPWWLFGPLAGPVIAVAARRGHVDHGSVPITMPMSGNQIPTGWVVWLVSGLDVAFAGCLPMLYPVLAASADLTVALIGQAVLTVITIVIATGRAV